MRPGFTDKLQEFGRSATAKNRTHHDFDLPFACHLLILGHRNTSIAGQDSSVFMALWGCSYCRLLVPPLARGAAISSVVGRAGTDSTHCILLCLPGNGNCRMGPCRIRRTNMSSSLRIHCNCKSSNKYRGADKSLARPGRKQATAKEEFDVHIPYL